MGPKQKLESKIDDVKGVTSESIFWEVITTLKIKRIQQGLWNTL